MLPSIDWTRPWFATVLPARRQLDLQRDTVIAALNGRARALDLRNPSGLPLSFVPQADLPEGVAYEEFIGATGGVPTRDNLHDFFNALVWLTFPRIKRQLNALQAAQIALSGVGKSRGPARDGATIFDENSALLVLRDSDAGRALEAALRGHDWRSAFIAQREKFGAGGDAEVWLFGHALMEKLVAPRKAITAHVICVPTQQAPRLASLAEADGWLDDQLRTQSCNLASKPYLPIPILGIPDWCLQNQNFSFYDDSLVFRAPRTAQTTQQRVPPERELA